MTDSGQSDWEAQAQKYLRRAKWMLMLAGITLTASITILVLRVAFGAFR